MLVKCEIGTVWLNVDIIITGNYSDIEWMKSWELPVLDEKVYAVKFIYFQQDNESTNDDSMSSVQ